MMNRRRSLAATIAALALTGCAAQTSTTATGTSSASFTGPARAATSAASAPRAPRHAAVGARVGTLGLVSEPAQGVAPFERAITHARRSVDLVIYELTDRTVEADLVADEHRGIAVRVLLDGGYHGSGAEVNQPAYTYLKANGVPVRWTPSYFALTHQKTLIIDRGLAYIMTLNLTPQYYATSRDFAVLDAQPADVRAIEQVFAADWTATRVTAAPGSDLLWSPGALAAQVGLIASARGSVEIYNEEMDQPQIEQALQADARRGVNVRVVMTAASDWNAAFNALTAGGVHVHTYPADAPVYIHAKMILIDGRRAFVGSQNFSTGSLRDNRELGIILTTPAIIKTMQRTFDTDYAAAQPVPASGSRSRGSSSGGSSSGGSAARCTASASYSDRYHDYDVYVHSNQPETTVTVTGAGTSAAWHTDRSGAADVYFKAPASTAGQTLTVQLGAATCTTTL
ncbi:MAG: phospholipase D-like domain-containing protein [Solirubrobacteraceae bacterium]